jgi:formyl-CoA transferase
VQGLGNRSERLSFHHQAPVWEKICDVIGEPGWKTHPDYAKPAARLPRLNEIFARIEQWTMTKTKFEAMKSQQG